ncbi:MAG: hypothetical protein Q9M29_04510 [Mariprofundaceae bacterium]|nr:hypothetical protein [Mariprofundaceae bacterium]
MKERKQSFEDFAKRELNALLVDPDAGTRMRLRAMRRDALRQQHQGMHLHPWLPATGLAAATIVLMLVWMLPREQVDPGFDMALSDIDVLASDADIDLLDGMEFYQWLGEINGRG